MQESRQILHEDKNKFLRNIFLYQLGNETNRIAVMRGLYFASISLIKRIGNFRKVEVIDPFFDEQNEPTGISLN